MKSYLTKFKGGISAWLSRDSNDKLAMFVLFTLLSTVIEKGATATVLALIFLFLWSLHSTIVSAGKQVIGQLKIHHEITLGLRDSNKPRLKEADAAEWPSQPEHPKPDS